MDIIVGIIGLIFIAVGILVGVFKQYWLIAGDIYSAPKGMTVDVDYIGKYFGIFFGVFGVTLMLSPFLFNYLDMKHEYRFWFMFCGILSFVGVLFLFGHIKKGRIYRKSITVYIGFEEKKKEEEKIVENGKDA